MCVCVLFAGNAAAAADADLSLASYRPEGLDHLVQLTDFSRKELQVLYRGFKNVRQHLSPNVSICVERQEKK